MICWWHWIETLVKIYVCHLHIHWFLWTNIWFHSSNLDYFTWSWEWLKGILELAHGSACRRQWAAAGLGPCLLPVRAPHSVLLEKALWHESLACRVQIGSVYLSNQFFHWLQDLMFKVSDSQMLGLGKFLNLNFLMSFLVIEFGLLLFFIIGIECC